VFELSTNANGRHAAWLSNGTSNVEANSRCALNSEARKVRGEILRIWLFCEILILKRNTLMGGFRNTLFQTTFLKIITHWLLVLIF